MSGFEVAGVVLGGVPVIVSALKLYIEGASTLQRWRFYTRELKSLIRSLETEQTKLQNVYERLLVDIVPATKIEEMIHDPFGPLWMEEASATKIHQRLWRSAKVFHDNVLDMSDAIEEMKKKLDLDADGKPKWIDSPRVKKEFQRVLFVLRRSDYQELIGRLRIGVSSLESLVTSNIQLEPDRNRRSKGRVCKVVRGVAKSVYRAVRDTATCACPSPHKVGLRLTPQTVFVNPYDDDEDVIARLEFLMAISDASTFMETEGQQWGTVCLWNHIALRPVKIEQNISVPQPETTPSPSHPIPDSRRTRNRFRASFASFASTTAADSTAASTTATSTATSTITTTAPSASQSDAIEMQRAPSVANSPRPPTSISNLCHALKRSQKQGAGERCGHIVDENSPVFRKFDVFPLDSIGDTDGGTWSMVPLGAILDGIKKSTGVNKQVTCTLTYLDRLRLAWTVASGVVQLHSTPWLASPPTHNDIFLIRQNNNTLREELFVLKRFPDTATAAAAVYPRDQALVALGVLLIELILGQPIERLCPGFVATRVDLGGQGNDQALVQILDKVRTRSGLNYHSAVRTCMDCVLGVIPRRRDGRMKDLNEALLDVVGFLEQDMGFAAW